MINKIRVNFLLRFFFLLLFITLESQAESQCEKYVMSTLKEIHEEVLGENKQQLGVPFKISHENQSGLNLFGDGIIPGQAGFFSKFKIDKIENIPSGSIFVAALIDHPSKILEIKIEKAEKSHFLKKITYNSGIGDEQQNFVIEFEGYGNCKPTKAKLNQNEVSLDYCKAYFQNWLDRINYINFPYLGTIEGIRDAMTICKKNLKPPGDYTCQNECWQSGYKQSFKSFEEFKTIRDLKCSDLFEAANKAANKAANIDNLQQNPNLYLTKLRLCYMITNHNDRTRSRGSSTNSDQKDTLK